MSIITTSLSAIMSRTHKAYKYHKHLWPLLLFIYALLLKHKTLLYWNHTQLLDIFYQIMCLDFAWLYWILTIHWWWVACWKIPWETIFNSIMSHRTSVNLKIFLKRHTFNTDMRLTYLILIQKYKMPLFYRCEKLFLVTLQW